MGALLTVEHIDKVALVTLTREEKRNALSTELCRELRGTVEALDADPSVRVIVLTGAGTVFCAGADLHAETSGDTLGFLDELRAMNRAIEAVATLVVTAVNGPAVGAGSQLLLASDLRIFAPGATTWVPAVSLGLSVDSWTVRKLTHLVGGGVARGLLLTGEKITAERALAVGLANRIGDHDEALAWAAQLATLAPLTIKHLKLVFDDNGSRVVVAEHEEALAACWTSEDMFEGVRAKFEKRAPNFQGK